jgi:hypothetical protein
MEGRSTSVMNDKIRWALPHEGLVVQSILLNQSVALAKQVNWLLPLGPYWLLYCDPHPVGCINVNPGMPVGRLEWLTVLKELPRRQYACAIRDLCYAGMHILKSQGSQRVAGYVADHDAKWKRVIERRGLIPVEQGTLYMGVL